MDGRRKKNTSDLWIWKQLAKHIAYGKDLPTQIGNYKKLKDLHSLLLTFVDNQIDKKCGLCDEFKKIKGKYNNKEKFNRYVINTIESWSGLYNVFHPFYKNKLESNERIVTEKFVKEFIAGHSVEKDAFIKNFELSNDNYYNAFKKVLNHLEEEVWVTASYYLSPLFSSFSYYAPWRWFYLLWFYYQLILLEDASLDNSWVVILKKEGEGSESKDIKNFPLPYSEIGCAVRNEKVNGSLYFLVFGPIFAPTQDIYFNDRETYREKIKPTILLFRIFQILLNDQTDKIFSKSLTEADIFLKACGTKPYVYSTTLKEKIRHIQLLFDILIESQIYKRDDVINKSERHIWILVSLLRWAIFIYDLIGIRKSKFIELKYYNTYLTKFKKFPIYLNLSSKHESYKFLIKTKIENFKIKAFEVKGFSDDKGTLSSSNKIVIVDGGSKFYKTIDLKKLNWLENEYINFNSNFDIRTRTSKQPYLLAAWLRRHFYLQQKSDNDNFNKHHKPICKNICELFDADAAIIYTYHHAEESLKLTSSWFADKMDKNYEKGLADKIASLEKGEKKKSICYRAVEFNTVQFTLAFNPTAEVNKSTPENCELVIFDEIQMRSAIAVPLLFKGRLLGILEIAGKKEYQFGWTNREILNQTSIVLSTAFYQQRLVNALHRIANTVLNINEMSPLESYNKICKYLASIFLCESVSLWFKSEKNRNKYHCLGAYNQPLMIEQLKADPSAVFYTADDDSSIEVRELIKKEKKFTDTINIEENEFQKSMSSNFKIYRKKLLEHGMKYCTYFSLLDEHDEFCGSISLHDKEKLRYEDWDSMYLFISNFVNVALELVNVFAVESNKIRNEKEHEIRGTAKMTIDRVKKILHILNTSNLKQLDFDYLNKKLHLIKYDLKTFVERLTALIDNQSIRSENITDIQKLSLEKHFSTANSSYFLELADKKIECNLIVKGIINPLILMDKNDLNAILSNLISNVSKYAFEKESVNFIFEKVKDTWKFHFSNKGAPLKKGEDMFLFKDGFRSEHAVKNNIDGEGIGLSIVRHICDKYGMEIYYSKGDLEYDFNEILHTFTIEIPPTMVIKGIKRRK